MSARRLAGILAVVAATVGILAGPASAAEDGRLSVRLTDAPENRRDDPRALVYIVDHLPPGSTITRHIEVTNDSRDPMQVDLYPGPVEIVDGAWTPLEEGATSELTGWTTMGEVSVDLSPGQSVVVPVTIDVPDDASRGERYGVVWAQTASSGDGQVRMVSRVGIRVYLSIGPGGEPATDFTIDSLTGQRLDDDTLRVLADVTNTGGRAIDLQGELSLTEGPNALSAGPYAVTDGTTLGPGESGQVAVDLDPTLPLGPWHALLELSSGKLHRSAEADLTFPQQGMGDRVLVESADGATPWWVWLLVVVLALVLVLAVLWLLAKRRRRPDQDRPGPGRHV